MIETCTHVGLYLGISQGMFYDRFGPKNACLLAGYGTLPPPLLPPSLPPLAPLLLSTYSCYQTTPAINLRLLSTYDLVDALLLQMGWNLCRKGLAAL
jgi:hypothetical protein